MNHSALYELNDRIDTNLSSKHDVNSIAHITLCQ